LVLVAGGRDENARAVCGTEKLMKFHDKQGLVVLEREGGNSKAIAVKDASHWLDVHQPNICYLHDGSDEVHREG